MDVAKAKTLRVVDLRKELKKRGLKSNGRKAALQERLIQAIEDESNATKKEREEEPEGEEEVQKSNETEEKSVATEKEPATLDKADLNNDGRTTRSEAAAFRAARKAVPVPTPTPALGQEHEEKSAHEPVLLEKADLNNDGRTTRSEAAAFRAAQEASPAPAPIPAPTPAPDPPPPSLEPEDKELVAAPAASTPKVDAPESAPPLLKNPGHIYVTANNLATINLDDLKSFFGCVGTVTRLISLGHCVKVTYQEEAAATGALELNGTPFGHSGKLGITAKEPSWQQIANKQAAAKKFAERKAKLLASFAPPAKRKAPPLAAFVPNQWEKRWDTTTGLAYYYNIFTRAKTDTKPHGFDHSQFEIANRQSGMKIATKTPLMAGTFHQKKVQEPAKKKWRPPNGMTFKQYKEHRKLQKWKRNGFI